MKKGYHICYECEREMERCKPAISLEDGSEIVWVCRQCWKKYDYDAFM